MASCPKCKIGVLSDYGECPVCGYVDPLKQEIWEAQKEVKKSSFEQPNPESHFNKKRKKIEQKFDWRRLGICVITYILLIVYSCIAAAYRMKTLYLPIGLLMFLSWSTLLATRKNLYTLSRRAYGQLSLTFLLDYLGAGVSLHQLNSVPASTLSSAQILQYQYKASGMLADLGLLLTIFLSVAWVYQKYLKRNRTIPSE